LFEKNEKYVIVCRSGQRSGKVSEFLRTKDIISYNLLGGMKKLCNFSTEIISSNGNPGTII
jgi:Rhodanese-related sulfurtransferase